ncbi:RNA polymerase sigma factor, sigma-70 family [Orenia metallireducens]|uniref:RNA polymerase sigma factor n=1 Tax=Orenia metallireducens TaxID=1413210 RepID=A0A285G842_9FIRM|nr:sigma-70 family RNA polymerase sigma factor [Orenia metallireducens]SNY19294.1 RNA polymerase sigma factor, sigma-70 family [Orenia metallireducens]
MSLVKLNNFNTDRRYLESNQTIKLIKKYRDTGDKIYKDQAVEGNIGLVLKELQRWRRAGAINEFFQVGCIGLIKAIDYFDISKGVCFSTYAVPMISGEIHRWHRDKKGLSRRYIEALSQYQKIKNDNPDLSFKEIAEIIEVDVCEMKYILDCSSHDSLNRSIGVGEDGDSVELGHFIPGDDFEGDAIDLIMLKKALEQLPTRVRKIIILKYFEGKTQVEIGKKFGVSQAQISRLEKQALSKIRKYYEEDKIMQLTNIEKKIKSLLMTGDKLGLDEYEVKVLKLRLIKELSYEKMANRLGCGNSTAYKHYQAALEKLDKYNSSDTEASNQEVEQIMNVIDKKEDLDESKDTKVVQESVEAKKEVNKVNSVEEVEEPKSVEVEDDETKLDSDYIAVLVNQEGQASFLESSDSSVILKACELFESHADTQAIACKRIG